MSEKVFSSGKSAHEVAYDLALTLASKDPSITTPGALLLKIESLLPDCLIAAQTQWSKENPVIKQRPDFFG